MLDESMQKYTVSFGVSGGDSGGNKSIMEVSANNPGPTFNNRGVGVFSTIVLITGTTLACVVAPCGSMVVMVGITLAGLLTLVDHGR